jgi:hypothetical protein
LASLLLWYRWYPEVPARSLAYVSLHPAGLPSSLASRSMSAGTFGIEVCPTSRGREASFIHLKAPVEHGQTPLHAYPPYVLWTRLAPANPSIPIFRYFTAEHKRREVCIA